MHFRAVFLLMAFNLIGCASLHPRAQAKATLIDFYGEAGEVETAKQRHREALTEALNKLDEPEQLATLSKGVTVLEKTLPDGIEVSNNVIKAAPDSGLTVLGTITVAPAQANAFWFSDYSSPGRKVACYWQTPLTWVTLGMWGLLVPLNYPCWGKGVTPAEGYGLIRASAEAAGANVVVLTDVYKNDDYFGSAKGFLLKGTPKEKSKPAPTSAERYQRREPIAAR